MDRQKVAKEAIANFDKSHPHSSSEAKNFYIAGWLDGVQRFYSLVKRMREAQEELDVFEHEHEFFDYKAIMKRKELTSKVIKLESEVDEYLKKMEV